MTKKTFIKLGIGLIIIFLVIYISNPIDIIEQLADTKLDFVFAALLTNLIALGLRILRFKQLVNHQQQILNYKEATLLSCIGWISGLMTIGRIGELSKIPLMTKHNIPKTFGATVLFTERFLDIIVMVGLAFLGTFFIPLPEKIRTAIYATVLLVSVILLFLYMFSKSRKAKEIKIRVMKETKLFTRYELSVAFCITLLSWTLSGIVVWFCISAFTVNIGVLEAIFITVMCSTIATISFLPMGLGARELTVVGILVTSYNVILPEATAIALVNNLVTTTLVIIIASLGSYIYLSSRFMKD